MNVVAVREAAVTERWRLAGWPGCVSLPIRHSRYVDLITERRKANRFVTSEIFDLAGLAARRSQASRRDASVPSAAYSREATTAAAAMTCPISSIEDMPCSIPNCRRTGSALDRLLIGTSELSRIMRMRVSSNA